MVRIFATRSLAVILSGAVVSLFAACGDSGGGGGGGGKGGVGLSEKANIEIEFSSAVMDAGSPTTIVFQEGQIAKGGTSTHRLTIRNVGNGDLPIKSIGLFYAPPPDATEADGAAMQMIKISADGKDLVIDDDGTFRDYTLGPLGNGGEQIEVTVQFRRYDDGLPRSASLTVESENNKSNDLNLVTIPFSTEEGNPVANVSPKLLDFAQVKAGEAPVKTINVTNTGSDNLLINSVLFQGHPDYRFKYASGEGGAESEWEPGDEITFDPALVVEPDKLITFQVAFTPLTDVPAEGKVVFYTNSVDEAHTSGILVELKANTEGPCIQVNPKKVQFGGKLVSAKAQLPIEVISCGTAPLSVHNIQMAAAEGGGCIGSGCDNFSLEYTTLPGFEDGESKPTIETPLDIPVEAQATFNVIYVPSVENPKGEERTPIFDTGLILIESNAFDEQLEVEVTGLGVKQECPTAVGVIQEGEQVIPQTNLHLFGEQSFAPTGAVASWKWSVVQPAGSASVFVPSDTFPNPTFEVNTAGEFQFQLDVWDEGGVKSCVPWKQSVLVVPDEAIHVELLWDTPNDPDQTDQGPEAGSDVDLHFLHDAYAASGPDLDGNGLPDGWFDQPFDCFWFNAHPNWGSFDPSIDDDPGLDRDDTDGAGPENLNLNIPENTTYRVGVHYWSDHEYGPSFITLRIYIYSNLVFEVSDVKLIDHDLWDAATIDWPSGKVTLVQDEGGGGGYKITPNYQNPFFFQP